MSVQLLPGIGSLDPASLCHSLYTQLYQNFFNAQDKKDTEHPYGVEEGDDTSIRLRNTAYNFADAIAGAVNGGGAGGDGGVLIDYIKKSGGDMTGAFSANYGFEAGVGNTRIIHAYYEDNRYGIQVSGELRLGGESLYLGGAKVLRYDTAKSTATIESPYVSFGNSYLKSSGEMLFGLNEGAGVYISASALRVKGFDVWHGGNANLPTVDWKMKDGYVAGSLEVADGVTVAGPLRACHGVELGAKGKVTMTLEEDMASLNGYLSFGTGYGVKIGGKAVLIRVNDHDIRLAAPGGNLLLGDDATNRINLFAGLWDIDGDAQLISKYGAAYFPDSLRVRHSYGSDLLSSYRVNALDEGITMHKRLRFGHSQGAWLHGNESGITLSADVHHITPEERFYVTYNTLFGYRRSTSLYQRQDRYSDSAYVATDTDFFTFDAPVEAKGHIGIDNSKTRLADGRLFFTDHSYLLSVADGIRHQGNAYFSGGLSSVLFSSGFAGSGWAILKNLTTGNVAATFDELTVRKRMRVYELEVQKISATNGALWVSDSCSGDTVERIS